MVCWVFLSHQHFKHQPPLSQQQTYIVLSYSLFPFFVPLKAVGVILLALERFLGVIRGSSCVMIVKLFVKLSSGLLMINAQHFDTKTGELATVC